MFRDFGSMDDIIDVLMTDVVIPLCRPELPNGVGARPLSGILLHGPPGCGKTRLAQAIGNEAGVLVYEISSTNIISGVIGGSEENIRELFRKAHRTAPSIVFINEIDVIGSKVPGIHHEIGFLLYGPPGCGKTLIAQAVSNESGANFIYIKGPELLNKYVGESEGAVRTLFMQAKRCSPCILFFDEIDALASKRSNDDSVSRRVLTQLLIELDGFDLRSGVFIIGATNKPEDIDGAILRPGRLGEKVCVPFPSLEERKLILKTLTKKITLDVDVDLPFMARDCKNFSGADLASLVYKTWKMAFKEKNKPVGCMIIKTWHFEQAR